MRKAIGIVAALLLVALGIAFLRGDRPAPTGVASAAGVAQDGARAQALLAAEERADEDLRAQVSASTPASAGEAEAGSALAEDEELSCVVFGRVTEASGAAPGAKIEVVFEDVAGEPQSTETDSNGAYSITGLAPGRWLVSCSPVGFRRVRAPLEIPAGASSLRHDIALERADLVRIKVTAPDGRPFAEALREHGSFGLFPLFLTPIATREPPGPTFEDGSEPHGKGWLMEEGSVDPLPAEYVGAIALDRAPPVYVSLVYQRAVLATELVAAGEDDAVFVIDPKVLVTARAALRVCVVEEETGNPIPGAELMLFGGAPPQPPTRDPQGCAVFSERPPATYDLLVFASGREQVRRSVTLVPGETLDLGTLALALETSISGVVVNGEGRVAEASVELGSVDSETREVTFARQSLKCDRRGTFRIAGLGRGEFVVRARLPRGRFGGAEPARATANHLVSTLSGSVEGVELPLLPEGRLLLRGERPDWESLHFQAFDAQGLERGAGNLWYTLQFSVDLPRGPYRFILRDAAGALLLEHALELGEEPVVLDVPPY